ncbi:MAG: SDR family oxidoreductase [Deltaproteobacteria bacterium]|nr:MAG: SDR family oxidoreductase [Deltaproteobacteria bacterium]
MAHETAKLMASDGHCLYLVARKSEPLEEIAQDLRVRGASSVDTHVLDLNNFDQHEVLLKNILNTLGGLDLVFIAHGTLGNEKVCETSYQETLKELTTNFLSVVSLLTPIANYFEGRLEGHIVVISSVAGDRARQSNYVYGTAQGAKSLFLQGLRNRLTPHGVTVTTIKPGFVDTPMTVSIKKNFLFARADVVGEKIYSAIKNKKDIVYVPGFWRWIMLAVKNIPEKIFKHMKM